MAKKTEAMVKRREPGELLVHEESSIVCRKSGTITNPLGDVTITDMLGQPVIDNGDGTFSLLANAGLGTMTGVILDGPVDLSNADPTNPGTPLSNGATTLYQYSILARGPAAVNKDRLPATDAAGGALTQATFISTLESLGIEVLDTPPEQSVQTT